MRCHLAVVAAGLAGSMRTARTGEDQDGRCSLPDRNSSLNTSYSNEKTRTPKLLQRRALSSNLGVTTAKLEDAVALGDRAVANLGRNKRLLFH